MTTIPSTDQETAPRSSRSPAPWLWAALAALLVAFLAVWIYSAVRSTGEDRGIRGPADQGAPNAPPNEKQRPSSVGR
jgi:hypothetical protein